jgi:hypothetical protein
MSKWVVIAVAAALLLAVPARTAAAKGKPTLEDRIALVQRQIDNCQRQIEKLEAKQDRFLALGMDRPAAAIENAIGQMEARMERLQDLLDDLDPSDETPPGDGDDTPPGDGDDTPPGDGDDTPPDY